LKIIAFSLVLLSAPLMLVEAMVARHGIEYSFKNPTHEPIHYGDSANGKPLLYVVMGDSTAAGRGAHYGIAQATADHLSKSTSLNMINLGISGAKLNDIVRDELPEAIKLKPDLVLLSVGANDVTHFTSNHSIESSLNTILDGLAHNNPDVKVVVTGSPELGAVPRFAQPLRWFARIETERVNKVMEPVAKSHKAIWTPLAAETGSFFSKDHSLFAPDKFHPNDRGYATWVPFLNAALDKASYRTHI
jgi:acyl-CoA thioesterase I